MTKLRYVNELINKFLKINGSNYNALYLTLIIKIKRKLKN